MKNISLLLLVIVIISYGCVNQTPDLPKNTPEEVLDKYLSLISYIGISERVEKLKLASELSTGYALNSLNEGINYFEERKKFNSEGYSLGEEIKTISGQNPYENYLKIWEKINLNFEVLSKDTIETTPDAVKIKVNSKETFDDTMVTNVTEGEVTYILKNVDGYWKIADFINKNGELASTTNNLEKAKQETAKVIQDDKKTINQIKNYIAEMKQNPIYPMNQNVNVDYLSYKITKAETFTEMGTSMFDKTTAGKFVKIYLDITNNAKETKQIFTPRFTLLDSQGRQFDRVSDDMMYIADYLEFGKQLQPSLTTSGAIVFEVPKDSTNLVLTVKGDFASTSHAKIAISKIQDIRKDTTQQDKQDQMFNNAMAEGKAKTNELMNQCNAPFSCSSSCPDMMNVGQKDCTLGEVCCMQ